MTLTTAELRSIIESKIAEHMDEETAAEITDEILEELDDSGLFDEIIREEIDPDNLSEEDL